MPPDLLELLQAVYDVIGPYLGTTLEQFETSFKGDKHAETEVVHWCSITAAWLAYHEKFLGDEILPDEEERKLLGALIAISTGVEDVAKRNAPADVEPGLIQCYDDLRERVQPGRCGGRRTAPPLAARGVN